MKINLRDYSSLFDGDDATLALQEALRACRGQSEPVTLCLGGGTLHFYEKYAFRKYYCISNNDSSLKSIIFPLLGMQDLTVDGEGADLLFHGKVLPFVADQSSRITLRNFSVDYPHPFFFQGTITQVDEKGINIAFDRSQFSVDVQDGALVFACPEENWTQRTKRVLSAEFDRETGEPSAFLPPYIAMINTQNDGSFLSGMYRYLTPSMQGNELRLEGDFKHAHTQGARWVCTFATRENPGILVTSCTDFLAEDVTLYHTASMGIVCQLSRNITLRRFHTVVRPGSGRVLSVSADSTHFVNCTGRVVLENCRFFNMLDDALNVHGNYTRIVRRINDRTLLVAAGHYQQKGINLYTPGDEIRMVNNRTMLPVAVLTVKSSEPVGAAFLRLETAEPVPDFADGFTIENRSAMPELYIRDCESGANRPRGFLPGTWRHTEITGCSFRNMSCALHFTGDCNDWFESGNVEDVTVRNCRFENSAYAGGYVISVTPHILEGSTPFHRNIRVENNVFRLHEKRFACLDGCEGVVFRNNTFVCDETLPAHAALGKDGFSVADRCVACVTEAPHEG